MNGPTLQGLIVGFVLLGVLFWFLQGLTPSIRGQKILRAGFVTDCFYWLFTPIVTRAVTPVAVAITLVPVAIAYGVTLPELLQGRGPLGTQSAGAQALQVFILGDFLGYWQHRWFHGGWRWRFHAVHHSSTELDWLSSVRLHPVNDALGRLIQAVPIVAMGYDPKVVALFAPATTLYAIALHANLNWTYGPLRYVIASPVFHRWHHTKAAEGQDKNFAGFFPLWDLLFGTFYMPKGRQPSLFGIDDEAMPRGLLGQLAYPFRRRRGAGVTS
ncbi:MAG: sterol desaturase family protein [Alphaproteobacteria bacterium]|nr:sterol desaturase family protein [Alphaproteobacteria bacterium]